MVSRYVVDGIVIGGLVVGTMGVFYLANDLIGRIGNKVLRLLFTILSVGALGVLLILLHLSGVLPTPRGTAFGDTFLGVPNIVWYVLAYIVAICSLIAAGPKMRKLAQSRVFLGVSGLSLLGGIVWGALSDYYSSMLQAAAALGLSGLFLGLLYIIGIYGASLSDRRLQIFGLILTLIGIASQFVSPVLDALNIKVS